VRIVNLYDPGSVNR